MKPSFFKPFLTYLGMFFACMCAYLIVLTCVNCIPKNWIAKNLQKSSEVLIQENEKQIIPLPHKTEVLFNYSDVLMLNLIASVDASHPFESTLLSRKSYLPEQEQTLDTTPTESIPANEQYLEPNKNCLIREFYGMMHGDTLTHSSEYARYWHGHQVLLRPLLLFLDLHGIRIFLLLAMAILFVAFCIVAGKRLGICTALAFAMGLLSASIFTLTRSINESLLFLFTLASMIFLLCRYTKGKKAGIFFFIMGSIINFFDLLTSPILGCLLPLTLLLLCKIKEENANGKELLQTYLSCGLLWLAGYGFTWLTKWLFVDVFFGRNLTLQAFGQIGLRSEGGSFPLLVVFDRVSFLLGTTTLVVNGVICAILGIIQLIRNRKNSIPYARICLTSLPFLMSFLIPFLWCVIIRNHSFFHPFFTYRLFSISIIQFYVLILHFTGYYTCMAPKQLPEK